MMAMMGGVELKAEEPAKSAAADAGLTKVQPPPSINVGVIDLNEWGREILNQLACCLKMQEIPGWAPTSWPFATTTTPLCALAAQGCSQRPEIRGLHQTLSRSKCAGGDHRHPHPHTQRDCPGRLGRRQARLLQAPLANTIEDAKAIAKAARDAYKVVFQPGLQQRSHPQIDFLLPFIRSGAIGKYVMVRTQWHQHTI